MRSLQLWRNRMGAGQRTIAIAYERFLSSNASQGELTDYEIAWASGSPREGIRMLISKIRNDPSNLQLQAELLDMYVGTGDYTQGADIGKRLLEEQEDASAELIDQTARCLHKVGDVSGAYDLYMKSGTAVQLAMLLADEYNRFSEFQRKQALEKIDNAVNAEDNKDNAQLLHARGSLYLKMGEVERALETFRRCVEVDSEFSPGFHGLGEAMMLRGDYHEALHTFEAFFRNHPNYYSRVMKLADTPRSERVILDVTVKKALCYLHLEEWQLAYSQADAAVQMSKVIDSVPDPMEKRLIGLAHYYRARARAQHDFEKEEELQGHNSNIIEDLSDALLHDENLLGARLERARMYRLEGLNEEAEQDEKQLEELMSMRQKQ